MTATAVKPDTLTYIATRLRRKYPVETTRFRDATQPTYPIIPGLAIPLPDDLALKLSVQQGEIRATVSDRVVLQMQRIWPVTELQAALAWMEDFLASTL